MFLSQCHDIDKQLRELRQEKEILFDTQLEATYAEIKRLTSIVEDYGQEEAPGDMAMTVMNEGQKYIAPDRTIKRYPKFEPESYVMLRIVPAKWEDKWYQWNQELPANASPEALQQAKEFSELKLGYRGDLRFSQVEVFEMTEVMGIVPTQEQDTTFPNLAM